MSILFLKIKYVSYIKNIDKNIDILYNYINNIKEIYIYGTTISARK